MTSASPPPIPVTTPELLTATTDTLEDCQDASVVTIWVVLFENVAVAVNCAVEPTTCQTSNGARTLTAISLSCRARSQDISGREPDGRPGCFAAADLTVGTESLPARHPLVQPSSANERGTSGSERAPPEFRRAPPRARWSERADRRECACTSTSEGFTCRKGAGTADALLIALDCRLPTLKRAGV